MVLEHIKDDLGALEKIKPLIKESGRLILLVPAHRALFSGLDEELKHYRRYNMESLSSVVEKAGFEVCNIFEHNFVGALGWYWAGKIRKKRILGRSSTKLFDRLVPLLRPIDKYLTRLLFGVSVIVVAKVKGAEDL